MLHAPVRRAPCGSISHEPTQSLIGTWLGSLTAPLLASAHPEHTYRPQPALACACPSEPLWPMCAPAHTHSHWCTAAAAMAQAVRRGAIRRRLWSTRTRRRIPSRQPGTCQRARWAHPSRQLCCWPPSQRCTFGAVRSLGADGSCKFRRRCEWQVLAHLRQTLCIARSPEHSWPILVNALARAH